MNEITLPDDEPPVPEVEATAVAINEPAELAHVSQNPLDLDPRVFQAALDRRRQNRDALLNWIRSQLEKGVDFGPIHVVGKNKCDKGKWCDNPSHFSKPSLFKPGAEKIVGILGLSPRFPTLEQYEAACIAGTTINQIILRCELVDTSGRVVGAGIGARFVSQDSGDLNKALKMAKKSAYIDATITGAGLSEEYTLDLEDMPLEQSAEDPEETEPASELFGPKPEPPKAEPPKPQEICPCGSPVIEAKAGAKAKQPHRPYFTCELAHRAFKGEEKAKDLLAKVDAETHGVKHTWRWK